MDKLNDLMLRAICRLQSERKAVTALEYGLIAGILGVVIAVAFTGLGGKMTTMFTAIGNRLGTG